MYYPIATTPSTPCSNTKHKFLWRPPLPYDWFTDKAVSVCPVGAIMPKHLGYEIPIGERLYDKKPISIVGDVASHVSTEKPFIGDDSHE